MQNKKVFVAGCGGLGCYNVELLVRLGVGEIVVADGDVFNESNMNRQLYCTVSTLGKSKALTASLRWPGIVTAKQEYVTKDNAASLIEGCDLVIDALDNVESRKILFAACSAAGIPFIHGAIGDTNAQICVLYPGDGDILDFLYPSGTAKKIKTVSYTPAFCASLQISLADKILKGEMPAGRKLYITDLDGFDLEEVNL